MSECRVALLAGGKSGEREVSLASAEGAREALEEAGYTVTQLDPADKEDLKRLTVLSTLLFSVCMGNMGKTAPCRVFWKRSGSLISVAGYGRALWQWIK